MKIEGAGILITGAGRGIGRYLAEQFSAASARVGVIEKDPALCEQLRQDSEGRIQAWCCDVTDPAAVDATLQAIVDSGFDIDVLINNAGIIHSEPLVNLLSRTDRVHSRDNWRQVIATNLDAVFFVTSRVVERMLAKRRKGVVISISSISANGNPGQSAYSAAKAGVNALTHTWAKELGGMGLRFAAIAPGFIDTPSTRAALSEATLAKLQQKIPLRRLGDMQSIFQSARHIVENDYLTGSVLEIDGGLVL
ncbi:SDR family NAD(P)-dependent oxidoreductase [Janthinobacterium sp. HLX7-2]|uniref:SDR family NAD(P)-dependent oxidoreductase n=1 Tax=Janthinobacterium sp. HLX7-2 TaxID=1259331 RepID=UPI003F238F0F